MKKIITIIHLVCLCSLLHAQPALIREIPASGRNLTAVGNIAFFTSGDSLWKSDGTPGGTVIVKTGLNSPVNLFEFKGLLYFISDPSGNSGKKLWRSDGTASGTFLLKSAVAESIEIVSKSGNYLYFTSFDGATGRELYRTDGTLGGTILLKDIFPGTGNGYQNSCNYLNGFLYFAAKDPSHGTELWKTDGTSAGTILVKDIQPGAASGLTAVSGTAGNLTYLEADDGIHGKELWKTDGSTSGTLLVKDITPGVSGTDMMPLSSLNNEYYFVIQTNIDPEDTYYELNLWKSDGSAAGTVTYYTIQTFDDYSFISLTIIHQGRICFFIDGSSTMDLYSTNGTAQGTSYIDSFTFPDGWMEFLTSLNGQLAFYGFTDATVTPFWKSSGITAGSDVFHYFNAGYMGPRPRQPIQVGNLLFFADHDGSSSNGYPDNTEDYYQLMQTDLHTVTSLRSIYGTSLSGTDGVVNANGKLFITTYNDFTGGSETAEKIRRLWYYDPSGPVGCTASGTIGREYWANVPGYTIASIPVNNTPTSTSQLTIFESPSNVGDNYGERIRGYICPPLTGNYTFWIAGDDNSELWLSSDADPSHKVKIASVTGYTSPRQWNKYPSQQSVQINLVAGRKYYIEALHKEANGGDHVAVGWQLPGGVQERPIPGTRLSPFSVFPNGVPAASIAGPAEGQSYNAPATITIQANASDRDGTVSRVEFYEGTNKIGEDLNAPFSFVWNNVGAGNYTLTVKAIDNGGAEAVSSPVHIVVKGSTCTASGTLQREYWANVTGSSVNDIPVNSNPTGTMQVSLFEGPSNTGNNYGARYRGYICVPVTGKYTFWIAGDDNSELWLSTDDKPAGRNRIAFVNGFTNPRQWTKFATQQSAQINLIAGKKYYIEALHKEAYGNDHLSVGWQLPDGTLERPIPGTRLSPYNGEADLPSLRAESLPEEESLRALVEVSVFPNPVQKGIITLLVEGNESRDPDAAIHIIDGWGHRVYSGSLDCNTGCNNTSLLIDEKFSRGIYLINVTINGKVYSERMVVQ